MLKKIGEFIHSGKCYTACTEEEKNEIDEELLNVKRKIFALTQKIEQQGEKLENYRRIWR